MSDVAQSVPERLLRERASQAYAAQSRQQLEEKWILQYLPLVRHVVQKVASQVAQRIDREDLISAGTLGLVKAARAYEPNRDAEFKTYAYIRIRGAVLDELRGRSFVPTRVHRQIQQVRRAYQEFCSARGRAPDDQELADQAQLELDQLYQVLEEARRQHFLSVHGLTEDDPDGRAYLPVDRSPSPHAQAERRELVEKLVAALRELNERDRMVLLLYYERDLTMKETAAVLGVTESRVSQVHASALFKLSMLLKGQA
jgi:RNA polymerase sigma factor for flagellar operon FliA